MGSFDLFEQVVDDGALADAWLLVVRALEGGAFADVGLTNLFPGGLWWESHLARQGSIAIVRERADEAVDVFWRAVEAGHFADLEERLRSQPRPRTLLVDAFRERIAALLGLPTDSTWVDGLLQGWAL